METKEIKLTDVCDFQGGTQPPKEEWIDEQREGYVRMLQIRDFTQGKAEHVEFVKDTKKLNKCKADDILIGRYGASVGKILTGLEGAYNVAIIKTIPDETKLLKKYLYYVLTGIDFQNFISRIGARAAQAGFNKDDLTYFKLHLPSLENQERIANILRTAEGLSKQRQSSMDLLDDLLKFSFLKLFGDPIKNVKGWEISNIGLQCEVKGGKRIPKGSKLVKENTGFPYIKAGNIKKGKILQDDLEYLTPELRKKLIRYTVEKGDVCITVVGINIGDIGIVPEELHLANLTENANKLLIKDKNKINNIYLAHYLMMDFIQNKFTSSIRASGVPKLALFRIEQVDLLMPPIELQNRFANIVSKIETINEQYKASQKELKKLFDSLSQRAFRGDLNIIEKIEIKGTIKIQPKISAEVIVIEKFNKELSDFHKNVPHSGAPDDIDNTLRQLDAELKIRGEIPFTENYVKYRLIKEKQTAPFTFEKLWKEITEFPFESVPDYDEFSELLFEWLSEENSFIRQQYNEITKQTELILNETAKA